MTRENSVVLLFTVLGPDVSNWSAYYGTFTHLTTLVNVKGQIEANLNMTSPNSGSLTITKCTSNDSYRLIVTAR